MSPTAHTRPAEYPLINLVAPPWGLRDGHADATYYPVPWLLSSAGYGVLVDNSETSYFRLGSDQAGAWSVEVTPTPEGGETGAPAVGAIQQLALRFFAGPKPADALRRFTEATGRQPKPASPWVLGPWYQADDDDATEVAALRAADAPFSALQTYTHYLPCGAQVGQADAEAQRVATAHDAGLAITTYFNPMICSSYQPAYQRAAEAGALTRDAAGNPYLYRYGADVDQAFLVGQFDFTTEAGPRAVPRTPRRSRRHRLRRLDGGLRRVHAARLGLGRRDSGDQRAQPISVRLPLRRQPRDRRKPAPRRAVPAVRLDRCGAVRPGRLGRGPHHRVRL